MTFQPFVPFGGLSGWAFLQRTQVSQRDAFAASGPISRATEDFAARIRDVPTAEELTSDRKLLSVALGAFGLEDDIGNTYFIRKVLEEGTTTADALANRLADKRYRALSEAFGFGDVPGGKVGEPGFAERITGLFTERGFEAAIGRSDMDMRLALALERDLADVASSGLSNDGQWFTVMGTPPLRAVFEKALGLPRSFGTLEIDRQLDILKDRSERRIGSARLADFATPEGRGDLIRAFMAASEIAATATPTARGSAALALLTAAPVVVRA